MGLKELREKLKWLDPFTYVDLYVMPKVNPKNNEVVAWAVYLVSAFVFAWIFYTVLGIALGTSSPMVIVLSGSMQPLYSRGDVIVMQGTDSAGLQGVEVHLDEQTLLETPLSSFAQPVYSNAGSVRRIEGIQFSSGQTIDITKQGSVVVYWSDLRKEPIIHRVVAKLHGADGCYVITKGDSEMNTTVDQDCGKVIAGRPEKNCIALYPVPVEKLQGKAVLQIPFVGCFKLWLFDDLGSLITRGTLPEHFSGVC